MRLRLSLTFFYRLAVVLGVLVQTSLIAWSDHYRITEIALQEETYLQGKTVKVTTFSEVLNALGFKNPNELSRHMSIHNKYKFKFMAGESPGHPISVLKVLSIYSDEPDWGMDEELFEDNQYPELWRQEYTMMGGKHGTESRAFRHLYWPAFSWRHPIATFKLPLSQLFRPMGVADERVSNWLRIARKSKEVGQDYWALRFLALALHYVEDVSSPFHSTQLPTKKFALLPILKLNTGGSFSRYVEIVTQVVAYYHYCFEDFVALSMKDLSISSRLSHSKTFTLSQCLSSRNGILDESQHKSGEVLVHNLANHSVAMASQMGRDAMSFFPEISVPLENFKAQSALTREFWNGVTVRMLKHKEETENFLGVSCRQFSVLGDHIREVVRSELKASIPVESPGFSLSKKPSSR